MNIQAQHSKKRNSSSIQLWPCRRRVELQQDTDQKTLFECWRDILKDKPFANYGDNLSLVVSLGRLLAKDHGI